MDPISELTIMARGVSKAATRGRIHDRNQSPEFRSENPCKTGGIHTHPWDSSLLAFILGFSLFLFVFWNIITTFLFSRHNIKMAKALSQNTDAHSMIRDAQAVERDFQRWSLKYYASWYIVFLLSAISGFISGLILLFLLGMNIIYESFSLHSVIF
ncbi:hypothetical protein [Roseinatronobacter thiooxidans]|uniref:hypothetical protein n=1 Tax=Roseinatronobacter thiooxidans TaxID=121821 RepID=UPI0011602C7A|nr:hypothetical protein [Roseinatronobacter thiooxidans]